MLAVNDLFSIKGYLGHFCFAWLGIMLGRLSIG